MAVDSKQPLSRAAPPLVNPPGQPALHYRVGTFGSFFDALCRRIRNQNPEDAQGPPPLRPLNLEEPENWLVGLLDAWARVGDILTFYQERVINEGYLGTATQDLSVRELVRELGYSPFPALAATTPLALRAAPGKEMPQEVLVKAGTRVASLPQEGKPSQLFSTIESLAARSEWNEMSLAIGEEKVPQVVTGRTTSLVLASLHSALRPGAVLLLTGQLAGPSGQVPRSIRVLRTLEAAQPKSGPPGKSSTEVRWRLPLFEQDPEVHILNPQLFVFTERGYLFGFNAPQWDKAPVAVRRQYRPILGGVLVSSNNGETWQARNGDRPTPPGRLPSPDEDQERLPAEPVNALLSVPNGTFFTATDLGVYRAEAAGTWRPSTTGMRARRVLCLAADRARGQLFAGTDGGLVFRSVDDGETWEPTSGQSPATLAGALARLGKKPPPPNRPPKAPIRHLLVITLEPSSPGVSAVRRLLAATDSGIFLGTEQGGRWMLVNEGLPWVEPNTQLTDLATYTLAQVGQTVFAGTERGVFIRSKFPQAAEETKQGWTQFNGGFPDQDSAGLPKVRVQCFLALVQGQDSWLFAGSRSGLYGRRLSQMGDSWQFFALPTSGEQPSVQALTALRSGTDLFLLAGTSDGLFRSSNLGVSWEPLAPENRHDPVAALAVQGGDLVVATPFVGFASNQWPHFQLQGSSLDLSTVHQGVAPGGWLALFEAVTARVGIYRVATAHTVRRQDFTLSAMVTRVELESNEGLSAFDLRQTTVLFASQSLPLKEGLRPTPQVVPVGTATLPLPHLTALPAQRSLLLQGLRADDGQLFTQPLAVVASREEEGKTQLTIAPPLAASLTATSVKIYGNVVTAAQGELVQQVLGSGNAALSSQSFLLSKPLSSLPAPAEPGGVRSTLGIEINGLPWSQVPTLLDAGPADLVYTVRYDLEGRSLVSFGDGLHGARLPTGHQNVRATYRSGIWPEGLAADELTLLRSRPAGLAGVTNPLPVAAGIPPETLPQSRRRAPLTVRTLDRIVSPQDLQDFAASYPGIARALVTPLQVHGTPILMVTLAALEGRPVPHDGHLHRQLMTQVAALSVPGLTAGLMSYQPVRYEVTLRVQAAPGAAITPLQSEVEETLAEAFGFSQSEFRSTVAAYEISTVARNVVGVEVAELLLFRPAPGELPEVDGVPPVVRSLTSLPARVELGRVLPAQLLLLDPSGLRVEVEAP